MPSSTRFFHARSSTRTRSTALIACFLIGSLAFIMGLVAISRQNLGGGGYKCTNVKPRSVSVVWDKHGTHNVLGSDNDGEDRKRHKSMGFVGIQTGFASAQRRKSLRQTWMPSDRQSLQRYIIFVLLSLFEYFFFTILLTLRNIVCLNLYFLEVILGLDVVAIFSQYRSYMLNDYLLQLVFYFRKS